MLVSPVYERERREIGDREIVIIGFRSIPREKFQDVINVIKDFNAKYVPEKRLWFASVKDWEQLEKWFNSNKEWPRSLYVEADEDYEAVRSAL